MRLLDDFFKKKVEKTVDTSLFRLMQQFDSSKRTIHLFVEDEDDFQFYRHWVEKVFVEFELFYYPEKGKANVLKAYSEINWEKYPKNRLLFFVDKDFDDILEKKMAQDVNLFYTKFYSIENYLVTEEVYEIIISEIFRCKNDGIRLNILTQLRQQYTVFCDRFVLIIAWILVYRSKDQNADLDKISVEHFLKHHSFEIFVKRYMRDDLFDQIKRRDDISPVIKGIRTSKLKAILEEKAEADPQYFDRRLALNFARRLVEIEQCKQWIRGKYELWFLTEFFFKSLKVFFREYNSKVAEINKRKSIGENVEATYSSFVDITVANVFFILPPKINPPADIILFLKRNYEHADN